MQYKIAMRQVNAGKKMGSVAANAARRHIPRHNLDI
jgi:hypothetical protein